MARKRRHERKPKPKPKAPPPQKTATEHLHEKSAQSGPDAMDAAPTDMQSAQTAAAVYSTGPGDVVAYDYQRTGTYADVYNEQQTTDVAGQVSSGSAGNPT